MAQRQNAYEVLNALSIVFDSEERAERKAKRQARMLKVSSKVFKYGKR